MTQEIWTIKDVLSWSIGFLQKSGSESPRLDAELLLAEALECRRLDLYLDHLKPLEQSERNRYKDMIRRRAHGEPVAYITGHRDFFGLTFNVSPSTLIPRPETEHLIESILENTAKDSVLHVLDIGTGTGCLAIALKHHRPLWTVEAWDNSTDALAIAASNVNKLSVDVELRHVNALAHNAWDTDRQKFDIVVSNPPYIAQEERGVMSPSAIKFEPHSALFAEKNGLTFYAAFAANLPRIMQAKGKVYLEIGYQQRNAVFSLLEEAGWAELLCIKDLSGHDRVVIATAP
ncbi:MAG: peptide chain release factor N(5)-glutamine methyltransferase [Chitinophagaceae bacterium]|nr:peptide chain release factor N(5)-glutamine methyltransferase [Oligoflexus sp.]